MYEYVYWFFACVLFWTVNNVQKIYHNTTYAPYQVETSVTRASFSHLYAEKGFTSFEIRIVLRTGRLSNAASPAVSVRRDISRRRVTPRPALARDKNGGLR